LIIAIYREFSRQI